MICRKMLNEAEDIEHLNYEESLPVETAYLPIVQAASPLLCEEINSTLPEETVMASPQAVVMQDNADTS